MTLLTLILILFLGLVMMSNYVFAITDEIKVNLTVSGGGGPPPPPPPFPDPPSEDTAILCSDGIDNDGDTLIDLLDPDCFKFKILFPLIISNVMSTPGSNSSLITWDTNVSAISTISWGETISYEIGSAAETVGSKNHSYTITGLDQATSYYFKIYAYEDVNIANFDSVTLQTFTTLTGPDLVPPPAPTNFRAVYDSSDFDVNLSWVNPTVSDFDVVRIMRSTSFYPADENDGLFIYEGNGTFSEDVAISRNVTYYYSIFAKDATGNWSNGAIDVVTIPPIKTVPPDDDDDDKDPPPVEDPFKYEDPPEPDEIIESLIFRFIQEDNVTFFDGSKIIRIDGDLPLEIDVNYDDLPKVLKTIGITLKHPKDRNKVFAFILRVDESKSRYFANIAPLIDSGSYEVIITILDHKNQGLRQLKGVLSVSEGRLLNTQLITSLRDIVAPIGQAVGIAAGIVQTVVIATNAKSLFDVYLLLSRLFGALLGFLGIRRKSQPWGTVYDSVTKRPLDPAYVTVTNVEGEEKGGAITDLDGRYGFLLPKGVYRLHANKTNYAFPSKELVGKTSDELYNNLYFGDPVVTEAGQIIDRNIPLDPVDFDWNEFEKKKQGLYVLYSKREKIKTIAFNSIYVFGLASTIFALVFSPSLLNVIIMGLYVVMYLFQKIWSTRHRATNIYLGSKDNPLAFAIVRVYTSELNQQVKAIVADEHGRFFLLISPGEYYITVEAKEADGSYKRVFKSGVMELKKGTLPKDLVIAETP